MKPLIGEVATTRSKYNKLMNASIQVMAGVKAVLEIAKR
jgi:hypothetical protein